ncbi:uncharacterized protein LOC132696713 [Cylas formicarius]|uniref:uncharacterized protein LOC132696713 n=1 Tax=Cylas formicarius TaxID=197179 RepID=UPI002958351C|nr:uncharacterized protein LOC132696713 [Cylas formicarius]
MTTTHAMKRKKRTRKTKRKITRVACWNVTSWNGRDQKVLIEMEKHKIDICELSEIKRKGKGTGRFDNYTLIYSGKAKHERTSSGFGILLHEKYTQVIEEIDYINDSILKISLNLNQTTMHLVNIYAPDISKPTEESERFYEDLQNTEMNHHEIIIFGDLNAQIGDEILPGVKQKHNEPTFNENGELLIDFCARNELTIITPTSHTRHNTTNIGTDHNLVLCKLLTEQPSSIKKSPVCIEKYNIESLESDSTCKLYENRLTDRLNELDLNECDVETCWNKIKKAILQSADESIGKRKDPQPNIDSRIKTIKREHWIKFASDMDHDIYGAQRKVWKILKNRKKPVNEFVQSKGVSIETWVEYFERLYSANETHEIEYQTAASATVSKAKVKEKLRKAKNRKAPGTDKIPNELLKHGCHKLITTRTSLCNKILSKGEIPNEWHTSITILIFKEGQKTSPDNYRGITLLCTTMKLFTALIKDKLENHITNREEQQGFRKGPN